MNCRMERITADLLSEGQEEVATECINLVILDLYGDNFFFLKYTHYWVFEARCDNSTSF